MSYARAEDGSRLRLYHDSDNWSAFQTFIDAHSSILIPAGHWTFSKPINLGGKRYEFVGRGATATTLHNIGTFGGPVLGVGAYGTYAGSAGYGDANGTVVRGMTLQQDDETTAHCKCLYVLGADDFVGENIRVRDSSYEGIVSGSGLHRITFRNIEAWDCGNGGPAYTLSTAGINATSIDLLIEDFITLRCGQGVETGNTRVTLRRGLVTRRGEGLPSLGINIGSSVFGVYETTIEDCTVLGYDAPFGCGSGNGRIASVTFRRNIAKDAGVAAAANLSFMGGILNNTVPHADQGPTTGHSYIIDNEFYVTRPTNGCIGYSSGITDTNGLFGREPLTIARNKIFFDLAEESTAPVFFFAGEIIAPVELIDNEIHGLDAAPSRGDVQSFTLLGNPTVPGFPTLTYAGNVAYKRDGRTRNMVINIAGA